MGAQVREQKAEAAEVKKPNLTGIPAQMKLEFEQRSGLSFDDVRVHYNSDRPARLGALAYTQGTQIHVGPGHESSLPHELGHVIQQKTRLIPATRKVEGMPVNDDQKLEAEASRFASRPEKLPVSSRNGDCNAIQRDPTEEETFIQEHMGQLLARLYERGWELSEEECRALLAEVFRGNTPQIGNHYARLTARRNEDRRTLVVRKMTPTGDGGHMRTSALGVHYELEIEEFDGPPMLGPIAGSSEINKGSLGYRPRLSLTSVMGGSAADFTGKKGAEFLHVWGHQLGGSETRDNLVPGSHALNTAMIPIENAARSLAEYGCILRYTVTMIPGSTASYMEGARIEITVTNRAGQQHTWGFCLSVRSYPENPSDYMLNNEDYGNFQEQLRDWEDQVKSFCFSQ